MNKKGLFLPHNLDLSGLNMQAKLLNVWGGKQEFSILSLFELATGAGLEIGLVSYFRVISVDCVRKELFHGITL